MAGTQPQTTWLVIFRCHTQTHTHMLHALLLIMPQVREESDSNWVTLPVNTKRSLVTDWFEVDHHNRLMVAKLNYSQPIHRPQVRTHNVHSMSTTTLLFPNLSIVCRAINQVNEWTINNNYNMHGVELLIMNVDLIWQDNSKSKGTHA